MRRIRAKHRIRNKKRKIMDIVFIISLIALPLIQWGVFWLYPNARSVVITFFKWDIFENDYVFVGWQNYKEVFEHLHNDVMYKNMFFNTFHALFINLIILPVAVLLGYAFSKRLPGVKIYRVIFFLPGIISTVIMCLSFSYMFTSNEALFVGPAAKILQSLGFRFEGWDINNSSGMWALIYLYCIWTGFAGNLIVLGAAYTRVPEDLREYGRLEGIGFFRELLFIEIPLIMPTIATQLVNAITSVSGFWLVPMLLMKIEGADGAFLTVPWFMFNATQNSTEGALIGATTVGVIFSAILLPMIVLMKKVTDKLTPDISY